MTERKTWTQASLMIRSDSVAPSAISRMLGLEPTKATEKGVVSPPRSHPSEANTWTYDLALPDDAPLPTHMEGLVQILDEHAEAIAELAKSCEIVLAFGFGSEDGQGGGVFRHELLERLARHRVDVWLDLYPPLDAHP